MIDYLSSKGYFKEVNLPSNNKTLFPAFSLRKAIRRILHAMGAPIHDPCCDVAQTLTADGAVTLTTFVTLIDTTDGAVDLTLEEGRDGQFKFIRMIADAGDAVITGDFKGGTTLTFDAIADFVYLLYMDGEWNILTNSGVALA